MLNPLRLTCYSPGIEAPICLFMSETSCQYMFFFQAFLHALPIITLYDTEPSLIVWIPSCLIHARCNCIDLKLFMFFFWFAWYLNFNRFLPLDHFKIPPPLYNGTAQLMFSNRDAVMFHRASEVSHTDWTRCLLLILRYESDVLYMSCSVTTETEPSVCDLGVAAILHISSSNSPCPLHCWIITPVQG